MALEKVPIRPGVFTDDPNLTREGFWTDCNCIRFYRGLAEPIGGWDAVEDGVIGKARASTSWVDANSVPTISIGTHLGLFVFANGRLTDITPQAPSVRVTMTVTVSPGSPIVSVTLASHGLVPGQLFRLSNAVPAAVGGVPLQGDWIIASAPTSGTFTFVAGALGSALLETETGDDFDLEDGSGSLDLESALSASVEVDLTAATLDLNGGWTLNGSFEPGLEYGQYQFGWSGGSWGEGEWGTPRSGGFLLQPMTWSLPPWGRWLIANPRGGPLYLYRPETDVRAELIESAPSMVNYAFVTAERFLILLGTINLENTPRFDPMFLRGSRQGVYDDFEISTTSSAFFQDMGIGSELIAGCSSRNQSLVWSDKALFTLSYTGAVGQPYAIDTAGTNCGLIGPHAFAERDGQTFWMTPQGEYMRYDGGAPIAIPCPIRRRFYDTFVFRMAHAVHAFAHPLYPEIWWWLPTNEDAPEVNILLIYNIELDVWTFGDVVRTTAVALASTSTPYAIGDDGNVYRHEFGRIRAGSGRAFLRSAPIDIADGDATMRAHQIVVDRRSPSNGGDGNLDVQLQFRRWELGNVEFDRTFRFIPSERYRDFQMAGRMMTITISAPTASDWWRVGDIRMDIRPDGNR